MSQSVRTLHLCMCVPFFQISVVSLTLLAAFDFRFFKFLRWIAKQLPCCFVRLVSCGLYSETISAFLNSVSNYLCARLLATGLHSLYSFFSHTFSHCSVLVRAKPVSSLAVPTNAPSKRLYRPCSRLRPKQILPSTCTAITLLLRVSFAST